MQRYIYLILLLLAFCTTSTTLLLGQGASDCAGAFTLCSNANISFNPSGIGATDDFANAGSNAGCLSGDENNSAWYYFEFDATMPPGSSFEFNISPNPSADYDFAVFGPNVSCGALGSPIRCSWAGGNGATGLGNGATDLSEGAGGDGFVSPMTVNPGEGYYLLVDNWSGNGASFDMSFGGQASNYMDCTATPCELALNYTPSYSVCGGDPPLQLSGSVTGNSGTETYLWTEPSGGTVYMDNPTSPNPSLNFPPGHSASYQYTLTVTDGSCVETTTVLVNVNPLPMVSITGDASICQGGTGTLSATPGYNSYAWSPFGNGQTINISSPGLYTVTVTGTGGCQNTATFNVSESPAPTPVISGPADLCSGASAVLDAGAGYDTYQWQDGSGNQTLNISAPGTYSVTVSLNGCQGMATYTVNPAQNVTVTISGNLSFCPGSNTILDAGFGYASYQWQDGSSMQTLFVDTPGSYSVTVTDASGCTGTDMVTVSQLPPFIPAISGNLSTCTGSPATLSADPVYASYQWSSGETSAVITTSIPGTYILTVTDANGCEGINSVDVQSVPDPAPVISGILEICTGGSTTLSTSPSYATYQWSNGSTNFSTDVLSAGAISLTVTDANGCTGTTIVDVTESQPPQVSITGPTSVCGGNNITLSATPGYASYLWSDGTTSSDLSVNTPGTYDLTVTNQAGCEAITSYTVTATPPPAPAIDGNLSICSGSSTLLTVTGGAFNTYAWSDGSNGPTLEVQIPGPVSVTVTDANGCEGSTSVNVDSSPSPSVSISGNTQLCPGSSSTLQASPGFVSYLWSDGTMASGIEATVPGLYEVTATNAEGCEGVAAVTVEMLPAPAPVISGNLSFCEGQSTELTVNESYVEYSWYDGQSGPSASISIEGPVSVTVTDANGCQGEAFADVNQAPAPVPVINGPAGLCEGNTAVLDAGAGYDAYQWPDGSTLQEYEAMQAGQYTVTVTNSAGCEGEASILLEQYPNPAPQVFGDPSICLGNTNTLNAENGFEDYTWQDGTTGPILDIIIGGTYAVTVTDANGCEGEGSIFVEETPPLEPAISGVTEICDGDSTLLAADAGYDTYEWEDGSTGIEYTAAIAGTYSVTVTDADGCQGTASVDITTLSTPAPTIIGQDSICPGGSSILSLQENYSSLQWSTSETTDSITVDSAGLYAITVTNSDGCSASTSFTLAEYELAALPTDITESYCAGDTAVLSAPDGFAAYEWEDGTTESSLPVSIPGSYSYSVTDQNGCVQNNDIIVTENELPTFQIEGETAFCSGDNVELSGPGGMSYLWSNGSNTPNITVDSGGVYTLSITDINGCSSTDDVEIIENELPDASINGLLSFCTDGQTELSALAGMSTYNWSDGSNTESITVSTADSYELTVTDANGCQNTSSVEVTQVEALLPEISGQAAFCEGAATTIDAGDGYASYLWSDGSSEQSLEVSTPGTYELTVTDANGCEGNTSINVIENGLPLAEISGAIAYCSGDSTTLMATPGFTIYEWQDGTNTSNIEASTPGTYTVVVTDENGCQNSASVNVVEYSLPAPQITGELEFCPGTSTELSTGTAYTEYQWSSGEETPGIIASQAGTYELTVTDNNGCQGTASVELSEYNVLPPAINGPDNFCPGTSATLAGADGYQNYLWSNNSVSPEISVSEEGTYTLAATDQNGCESSSSIDLSFFEVSDPEILGETAFCENSTTTLSGSPGFQAYEWSNSIQDTAITVNSGGQYSLTVTDTNGCQTNTSVQVTENELPQVSIGGSASFCTGGFTTLNSGGSYQQYSWSTGSEEASIQVNQVGNYSLTVTDANGCEGSNSLEVVEASELSPAISGPDAFCPGESINLDAGAGYTTYNWSDGSTGQSLEVDAAGDYELTVTDEAGCSGSTIVSISEYPEPSPAINGDTGFCAGTSTTLSALGGNFTNTSWSDGTEASSIEVDAPGNYSLTITDDNGCIASTSVEVDQYALPEFNISGELGYCAGENTTLTATDGYAEYEWSNSISNNTITISSPGTYGLTVTSAEGCSQQQAVSVAEYALPQPAIDGDTSFCVGGSTVLSANNQFTSYAWSEGSATPSITVETAGIYELTVTNNNGCSQSTSLSVADDIVIMPEISGVLDFCPGTTTTLDVGGGYADYQWSEGGSGQSIEVSTPGLYEVTVVDADGCIGEAAAATNQFTTPAPEIIGDTGFCAGTATNLMVTGGDFNTYEWSNGLQGSEVVVEEPGNYSVQVTDDNNCQATAEVELEEYPLPDFVIEGETAFCEDSQTTLTISDSFDSYEWSTGDNSESITTSQSGNYALIATNEFGCTQEETITVEAIALPQADAGAATVINCYAPIITLGGEGSSQGSNYSYLWNGPGINANNEDEAFPTVDMPGTYTLVVIDDTYGCVSAEAAVEVGDQTEAPQVVLQVLDVLDCTTSSVTIDGSGSASGANIIYQWYDAELNPLSSANSNALEVEEAALFYLQVTDTLSGCDAMDSVMVQENEAYPLAEAGDGPELDCGTSEVTLDGSGSQEGNFIQYEWSTGEGFILEGANSNAPTVNQPGWYFIQVMDTDNGCSNMDSVLVTQDVAMPTAITGQAQTIDCLNPTAILDGSGSSTGPNFTQSWAWGDPDSIIANGIMATVSEPGTYFLIVTNEENQCSSNASVEVSQISAAPSAMQVLSDGPTCFGDEDGSIMVQGVIGGTEPYLYSLNGQAFSPQPSFAQLGAGNYELIVQDAIGCEHEMVINLEEGNDLSVELGENIEAQLGYEVQLDPFVSIPAQELVAIIWTAADSLSCDNCLQPSVFPSQSGLYVLQVEDENGCMAVDELQIFLDKSRSIYMPTAFSPNGDDNNDIFYVQGGQDVAKINAFEVYNRWGEPVFEVYNAPVNDPFYGWDGTFRGELYNGAVFAWYAEIEFIDGQVELFKGDVVLMR